MAAHIPAAGDASAVDIGRQRAVDDDIAAVRRLGRASTTEVAGGSTLLQPVALSSGEIAVVEVYAPDSEVTKGLATAWTVLAAVGIALVVGSVAVADRLGVRSGTDETACAQPAGRGTSPPGAAPRPPVLGQAAARGPRPPPATFPYGPPGRTSTRSTSAYE
jgi:hypothetical protein